MPSTSAPTWASETWCGTSQHSALRAQLLRAAEHGRRGDPRPLGIELRARAEPGDDVAPPLGVRHRELAQPALGLAGIHQRLQHAAVVVRDALVLEDADDDRVGVRGGRGVRGRCDSHARAR